MKVSVTAQCPCYCILPLEAAAVRPWVGPTVGLISQACRCWEQAGRVEGLASGEQLPGTLPSPLSLRRSVLGEHTAGKACGSQMWGLALPGTNSANRRPC